MFCVNMEERSIRKETFRIGSSVYLLYAPTAPFNTLNIDSLFLLLSFFTSSPFSAFLFLFIPRNTCLLRLVPCKSNARSYLQYVLIQDFSYNDDAYFVLVILLVWIV